MIQNYKIPNKFKNFSLFNANSILWTYGFLFLKNLELLLNKKNIIVVKKNLNIVSNKMLLNLELFYLTNKVSFFRKKLFLNSSAFNTIDFVNFFLKQFKIFKINTIILNLNILNFKVNKKILYFAFNKLKKIVPFLFSRRFTLFLDFIKILSLFAKVKIPSKIFLFFLQKILKNLTKKQHSQFISFIKTCFTIIIYDLKKLNYIKSNSIKGIKLIINGKLKGKTRSSSHLILIGNISTQTIDSKIDYSKTHVYTLYGVFGFKIWVSY